MEEHFLVNGVVSHLVQALTVVPHPADRSLTHIPRPGHKFGVPLSYLPELTAVAVQADHIYFEEDVFVHNCAFSGSTQKFGSKAPVTGWG